jgi:hypothetical protein
MQPSDRLKDWPTPWQLHMVMVVDDTAHVVRPQVHQPTFKVHWARVQNEKSPEKADLGAWTL